jgi:hypothetical protein
MSIKQKKGRYRVNQQQSRKMLDLIRLNFERIQLQIQDFRWQMSQHLMSLTPQQIRYLLKLHQGGMQLLVSLMSSHL